MKLFFLIVSIVVFLFAEAVVLAQAPVSDGDNLLPRLLKEGPIGWKRVEKTVGQSSIVETNTWTVRRLKPDATLSAPRTIRSSSEIKFDAEVGGTKVINTSDGSRFASVSNPNYSFELDAAEGLTYSLSNYHQGQSGGKSDQRAFRERLREGWFAVACRLDYDWLDGFIDGTAG